MPEIRLDFKVLVYPEDGLWIAHCLEMDLPAEGNTPQEAVQNLIDIADVQITSAIDEVDLESIFSSAPAKLWRLYAMARDREVKKPGKPVNRLSVRELELV